MALVDHTVHFTRDELVCRCGCGDARMELAFMELLEEVRRIYGKPMPLSSGYRCPDYNEKVSSTGRTGPHTQRKAVDVKIYGAEARRLIEIAIALGMEGIGVKQHGPHDSRFLHLDWRVSGGPRPWLWSYS